MKIKTIIFNVAQIILVSSFLCGCDFYFDSSDSSIEKTNHYGVFTKDDFLAVSGTVVKNNKGNGEIVTLRGTNAGGYGVLEGWMTGFKTRTSKGSVSHKVVSEIFYERFGDRAVNLWQNYRNNYWDDDDFYNCAEMGMNVIRLPFTYMNVDPLYHNVPKIENQKYNFTVLDEFIEGAAFYGIYTILDMHGAYGSQNGQDHSGEIKDDASQVDFYTNNELINKTVDLWTAIADRYKDNPAVAGYDILNEPGEKGGATTTYHFEVYDRIYKGIRSKDQNHIVIMESCWGAKNLPHPEAYNWENVVYSFHHYTGTSNTSDHMNSMINRITEIENENFKVPLYMGEFTCYNSSSSWNQTLSYLNSRGWHWTSWTYKVNIESAWGIYNTHADKVDPDNDSFEEIKAKWDAVSTNSLGTTTMTFDNNSTLFAIIQKCCRG